MKAILGKRILGMFAACAVLLTSCGGLESPDFQSELKGIEITSPNTPATAAVGGTLKLTAIGLYSTPPGTALVAGATVPCGADVCTQGDVSGVVFSLDPIGAGLTEVATITADGLATGKRRGTTTVRARKAGVPDDTLPLIVDGIVLTSFNITATPAATPPATVPSVPVGRSFTLTATPVCSNGATPPATVQCTRTDYNYQWSLPINVPADTVTFSPNPPFGPTIVAKVNRFGGFSIDAMVTNEEGTVVTRSIALRGTERVLDDIIVSADPAQSAPVPIIIGSKTRFVARGLFSDGLIAEISASDLRNGASLVWSKDTSAVGDIIIEDNPSMPPNTAILVSGNTVGVTGLTVSGTNVETTQDQPNGLPLTDRIGLDVKTFGLLGLVDICPFNSVGTDCLQNLQLPLNSTTRFKVRGRFSDNPNTPRDIDQTKIPLIWSKTVTTTSGDVTVVSAGSPPVTTGEYVATVGGAVTLNVSLASSTFEPSASPRTTSTNATVIEPICTEQFSVSNGASTTVSSANVTNGGSVIDADPNTFGNVEVDPSILTGGPENLAVQRAGTVITPATAQGQSIGFIISYDEEVFSPDSLATIQTLNAAGTVVQDLPVSSSNLTAIPARNGDSLVAAKATATMPFTGLRLTIDPPAADPLVPIPVVGDLLALLLGGGSTNIRVYAACSAFGN
ncbi:MAG: hypothetical protein V4650_11020 [Pseudomonadota bacterium]